MSDQELTPSQSMMHLFMGFIPARAIYVAAKLGIADLINETGASAQDIARKLEIHPDALYRIMRILAGIGVFHRDRHDRFFLTPLGETLRTDSIGSVRDYTIQYHELVYPAFSGIIDGVRSGKPGFDEVFGMPVYEYFRKNPEQGAIFNAGLANRTRVEISAIMEAYDFSRARRVVDVGGGNGSFLSSILTTYGHASGVLLDQGAAIEAARSGLGGPLPRCELVDGDFLEEVPSGGDTYLLKLVLPDWSDEESARILRNCRMAITDGGHLLVIDGLISRGNELNLTDLFDLTLLVFTGGRARTEEEFSMLLRQSGFRLKRVIPTASQLSILEACPVGNL